MGVRRQLSRFITVATSRKFIELFSCWLALDSRLHVVNVALIKRCEHARHGRTVCVFAPGVCLSVSKYVHAGS